MIARRDSVLREMGLGPIWRLRATDECEAAPAAPELVETPAAASAPSSNHLSAEPRAYRFPDAEVGSVAAIKPAARADAIVRPSPAFLQAAPDRVANVDDSARQARIATLDWDALECDISSCTACGLCERRQQAVPGGGARQADWMLVGDGPGAEDDGQGEAFVGAVGQLLDAMLASIGLHRTNNVFVTNTVKCRPPHSRIPESLEIESCFPYLARQIELVRPRIIIALGRPAAQALLKIEMGIGAARGQVFHFREIPVIVTYHPTYLLRNSADKAKTWEDLCFARRLMTESPTG